MAQVIPAPIKLTTRTKPSNIPFALRFIGWSFSRLERIAPPLAHRWFVNLFFSPPRYAVQHHEKQILQQASRFSVQVGQHQVQCYRWGKGPAILMVHGWAGRASQFRFFIEHFVTVGYSVISFDAIGHGLTKGKQTTIIDFKEAILEIEKKTGAFHAAIGHSLGGGACLFALSEGLQLKTLITISTPTLGDEIIDEFALRLRASSTSKLFLKKSILARLNRTFDEFMATHFIQKLKLPINFLVLHDAHDKEASLQNAEKLLETYPAASFIKTENLGHVRILKDDSVIAACVAFIEKNR